MSVNETFITYNEKSVTNDRKIADTICTVRYHQHEHHMEAESGLPTVESR